MSLMGLPSLRALDRAQGMCIWLAAEATDMRCGVDRLAERVLATIGQDPLSGHYFLFRSRRGDRLKIVRAHQHSAGALKKGAASKPSDAARVG